MIQPAAAFLEKTIGGIFFLAEMYSRPYRQVVAREIELAGITSRDSVINIGCGAVPFTAVYLALLAGVKVRAFDRDEAVLEKARFCLEKMSLEKKVTVLAGDGAEIFPAGFTAAVIALQAAPKDKILKNLLEVGAPGARLVFREASVLFKSQYDFLPEYIQPAAAVSQSMRTFDRSVLFRKEQQ